MADSITIGKQVLFNLKRRYSTAINQDDETFFFEDGPITVRNAKFLIEYLEKKFKN